MATASKTWTWNSSLESWELTGTTGDANQARDTSNGSPDAGSLQMYLTPGRTQSGYGYFDIDATAGTWASVFGISSSATITHMQVLAGTRTYCGLTHWLAGQNFNGATATIYHSYGMTVLWERSMSTQDSGWNTGSAGSLIDITDRAASADIAIRINLYASTGNTANSTCSVHLDYFTLELTYVMAGTAAPVATAVATASGSRIRSRTVEAVAALASTATGAAVPTANLTSQRVAHLAKNGTDPGNNTDPTSTWVDTYGDYDGSLSLFAWTEASGWRGTTSASDPYRLQGDFVDSIVDAGDTGVAEGTSKAYSHEVWFTYPNGDTDATSQYIFCESQDSSSTGAMAAIRIASGNVSPVHVDDSNVAEADFAITGCNDGNPHHIVATSDGSTLRCYKDGSEVGTTADVAGKTLTLTNSRILGRKRGTSESSWFKGAVIAVRTYSTNLSANQVTQIYNGGPFLVATEQGGGATKQGTANVVAVATVNAGSVKPARSSPVAAAVATATGTKLKQGTASVTALASTGGGAAGGPLTVWSTTADGHVTGLSATYSTARSTATSASSSSSTASLGQRLTGGNFYCHESFVSFDTSSVGAGSTVTVATLSFYGSSNQSTTDFIVQARIRDWGTALETTDWVAGDNLDDYTLVATRDTSVGWSIGAYTNLTSDAAFLTNIAQTGTTYVMSSSDRQLSATEPGGDELVGHWCAEDETGGGTDRDPKLYVEWTAGGGGPTGSRIRQRTADVAAPAAATATATRTRSRTGDIVAATASTATGFLLDSPATVTVSMSGEDRYVEWTAVTGASGYVVERSVDGGAWTQESP